MAAEVVVRGHGSVEVAPDAARLVVDARARARGASSAHDAAATTAAAVDTLLDEYADAIRRRSTSGLLVTPAHEWRDSARHFVGWDAVRSTTVEVVTIDAIGPLFAGFAAAGAAAGNVEWVVDPGNAGHSDARRAAAVDAHERAAAYADALGVALGPVIDVREPATKERHHGEPYGHALALSGPMADGAMTVEAPQLRVEATVDVTFAVGGRMSEPLDPIATLHRVAYCLDRILVEGHRVQAYLKAADVIAGLPPGELDARHAAGTLTELAGIGPKTASIISQALDGGPVPYLEELEATTVIEASEPGAADLRAALKGDCHTHSTWSDGGASIDTMARAAIGLGHEWMVLTDHSARLTVAHGLNAERLRAQLREVAALNEELAPFRILTGMEVDILADGALDLEEDLLDELDVVVASVHSKLSMPAPDMTRRMVAAIASPHVDILGHCTGQKVPGSMRQVGQSDFPGRVGSSFDAEIVFAACSRFDTAVEINCRPERQDPPDRLLALALEWECRVAIDTDAHAPGQLEWQPFGCDKAVRHGIEAGQVVNAMAADDLVAWAGSHPTS